MIIQLRSIGRAQPEDLAAILPTLSEAAAAVDLDHSRLAVTLDWVQYRKNFRAPVMVRPFLGRDGAPRGDAPLAEIAIDVRRAGDRPAAAAGRDRRAPVQGPGAHARHPRVHAPRGLGAPEQERDLVVQPQLLAPSRRVG